MLFHEDDHILFKFYLNVHLSVNQNVKEQTEQNFQPKFR